METILARDMVKEYTASYATYVAQDRAIPSLVDGLKPVQRRCINSANDLKLYHNKKPLKVAKLSGQVMGDYHPHGGANPVLMAQPFRFRYPLFDGQGNYGSPDSPNSYAAARYLEIRLSKFCEDFYLESSDYADREDNYDGRLQEITQYYPALPGCLFTGASGIAVGFSAELPAHTITDIGNSLLAYMKNPKSAKYLEGLYPETCESSIVLTPLQDIRKIYETGEGSVRYKASTHYETIGGKSALVVDAFPPGFSKKRLDTPSIMDAVDKGLLEVSNESAENIRYVFTSTDKKILEDLEDRLTSSIGYRMYIEHNGIIKLYKLFEIYDEFLEERSNYIVRKYTSIISRIAVESEYLRVLIALKKDKRYIKDMFDKESKEVIEDIQDRYSTTESVAKRVISTTIRNLLADNTQSLLDDIAKIERDIKEYQGYVDDPLKKIKMDIKTLMKSYSDPKRAIHIDQQTDETQITYRGKDITVSMNRLYFVGHPNNTIERVYGRDLANMDLSDVFVVPANMSYYFLYDNKGCCTVSNEIMLTSGSKLNSSSLLGIIGINDLEDITVEQGNRRIYKGVKWSLRQKTSYIRLSKEGEPDFKVIKCPEAF